MSASKLMGDIVSVKFRPIKGALVGCICISASSWQTFWAPGQAQLAPKNPWVVARDPEFVMRMSRRQRLRRTFHRLVNQGTQLISVQPLGDMSVCPKAASPAPAATSRAPAPETSSRTTVEEEAGWATACEVYGSLCGIPSDDGGHCTGQFNYRPSAHHMTG